MVNINDKPWNDLQFEDIESYLQDPDSSENFFFEYKLDKVDPAKLVKEISAFANTYGGYILLGVGDDKSIVGCTAWDEQRIHVTVHHGITPTPEFDIREFSSGDKTIYVIKIEAGTMPPYITNKGDICERVSSGAFVINESGKLNQLYQKRADNLIYIKNKIELPEIKTDENFPKNIFAYLDFGISVINSEETTLQKDFYQMDMKPIAKYLREECQEFNITRVGYSYVFGLGSATARDQNGNVVPTSAGIHDFMEVMPDGSVRGRLLLTAKPKMTEVDITSLVYYFNTFLEKIYYLIFGENYSKTFICAHKYEKLTVLKQFTPFYGLGTEDSESNKLRYRQYLENHKQSYGDNLIMTGNRIPKNDYLTIDRQYFDKIGLEYTTDNLYAVLFHSAFANLGYIDPLISPEE